MLGEAKGMGGWNSDWGKRGLIEDQLSPSVTSQAKTEAEAEEETLNKSLSSPSSQNKSELLLINSIGGRLSELSKEEARLMSFRHPPSKYEEKTGKREYKEEQDLAVILDELRFNLDQSNKEKIMLQSRLREMHDKFEAEKKEHAREIAQLKSNMFNSVVESVSSCDDPFDSEVAKRHADEYQFFRNCELPTQNGYILNDQENEKGMEDITTQMKFRRTYEENQEEERNRTINQMKFRDEHEIITNSYQVQRNENNDMVRVGYEMKRVGDQMKIVGDEIKRGGDEMKRGGDEMKRGGDEMKRGGDEKQMERVNNEMNRVGVEKQKDRLGDEKQMERVNNEIKRVGDERQMEIVKEEDGIVKENDDQMEFRKEEMSNLMKLQRKQEEMESEIKKLTSLNKTLQNEILKGKESNQEDRTFAVLDEKILENLFDSELESDTDDYEDDGYGDRQSKLIRKHKVEILSGMNETEKVYNSIIYLKAKNRKLQEQLQEWKRNYWLLQKSALNQSSSPSDTPQHKTSPLSPSNNFKNVFKDIRSSDNDVTNKIVSAQERQSKQILLYSNQTEQMLQQLHQSKQLFLLPCSNVNSSQSHSNYKPIQDVEEQYLVNKKQQFIGKVQQSNQPIQKSLEQSNFHKQLLPKDEQFSLQPKVEPFPLQSNPLLLSLPTNLENALSIFNDNTRNSQNILNISIPNHSLPNKFILPSQRDQIQQHVNQRYPHASIHSISSVQDTNEKGNPLTKLPTEGLRNSGGPISMEKLDWSLCAHSNRTIDCQLNLSLNNPLHSFGQTERNTQRHNQVNDPILLNSLELSSHHGNAININNPIAYSNNTNIAFINLNNIQARPSKNIDNLQKKMPDINPFFGHQHIQEKQAEQAYHNHIIIGKKTEESKKSGSIIHNLEENVIIKDEIHKQNENNRQSNEGVNGVVQSSYLTKHQMLKNNEQSQQQLVNSNITQHYYQQKNMKRNSPKCSSSRDKINFIKKNVSSCSINTSQHLITSPQPPPSTRMKYQTPQINKTIDFNPQKNTLARSKNNLNGAVKQIYVQQKYLLDISNPIKDINTSQNMSRGGGGKSNSPPSPNSQYPKQVEQTYINNFIYQKTKFSQRIKDKFS